MEKIYGYKEQDILGLTRMIRDRKNQPLSSVFEDYAIKTNKAKGTIRNLYYALVKLGREDKEFCNRYLGGKPISAKPIIEFDKEEEKRLVKEVLLGKKDGRSVRSVIMEMAGGDGKLALRYQNKYRNAVKNKEQMVSDIIAEIKGDSELLESFKENNFNKEKTLPIKLMLNKMEKEINTLVFKATYKLSKENEELREKINKLEKENFSITKLLCVNEGSKTALKRLNQTSVKSLRN